MDLENKAFVYSLTILAWQWIAFPWLLGSVSIGRVELVLGPWETVPYYVQCFIFSWGIREGAPTCEDFCCFVFYF